MLNTILTKLVSQTASVLDGIVNLYEPTEDLEHEIAAWSLRVVGMSAVAVIVFILAAWAFNDRYPKIKLPLFILIAGTMALSTLSLIGATVYLNVSSDSGGPVHWHADFEYWACGNELELRDPTGFSNKIGTSTLHEHDDRRIHLEGVVVDDEVDASLGKFMHVVGGAITENAMVVPLNPDASLHFEEDFDGDGPQSLNPELVQPYFVEDAENGTFAKFVNGQTCGDQEAEVQVFVYSFNEDDDTYEQTKLENPVDYVIRDNPNVPPGDCVIFEFDVPKDKTDKLCEQYGVRDIERCEEFGVTPEERSICTITQINYDSNLNYIITPETEELTEIERVQGIQTYSPYTGEED